MSNSSMPRAERDFLRYLRDIHFKNQNGLCYFCDCKMTPADAPDPKPGSTVTVEHLKGVAHGGGSNFLNTAASCRDCNQKRSMQVQKGRRTIPRITVRKTVQYTYGYTTPDQPKTLVLMNSPLDWDEAIEEARSLEGKPITLKSTMVLPE